jgi:ABC-type sugar transport system ATPase subunit
MNEYILQMHGISKKFPGVKALDRVSINVRQGEAHALVGENGAGKSTLMKILNGVYRKDEGEILIDGEKAVVNSATDAKKLGISIIYQEYNLIPALSIMENVYLNRLSEDGKAVVDWKSVKQKTENLLGSLDFHMDVNRKVEELTVAEMQMIEIAKSLSENARIIVMDEPSATLTNRELEKLFRIIETLKSQGITVIYISHRLEEIFRVCETVTILRDGKTIDTVRVNATTKESLIEKMVGRSVENEFPRKTSSPGDVIFEARNVSAKGAIPIHDVSFTLRKGEILGLGGLVGAGRSEVARAIFGADKILGGEVILDGARMHITSPVQARKFGIGLVPEDRKRQGLFLDFEVFKNVSISNIRDVVNMGVINRKKEFSVAEIYVDKLAIKTPGVRQQVINLSGGNQQKVVLSKWLFADVDILIMDEPTRGVDVGAKYEIYTIMNKLAEDGKSIIFISSELPELLAMSDRVIVIHDGRVKGELERGDNMTAERVMELAIS